MYGLIIGEWIPSWGLTLANALSELSSDLDNGKDYYDGLVDITHASEVRKRNPFS